MKRGASHLDKQIATLLNFISTSDANQRLVIGLDGLSRSGKTTFSNKLCEILKEKNISHQLIHIDDHIVERKKRYQTGHEEWFEYYQLQWDVEWLTLHLFEKLKLSNELNLSFYDLESDTAMLKTIQLPIHGVIVIEGVFLQRKEWRRFFDRVVYLDCPRSKRFVRESEEAQENLSKFTNRYWKAEDYYLCTMSPKEQADLVIKEGK